MAHETRKKPDLKNAKHMDYNWTPYCPNIQKSDERFSVLIPVLVSWRHIEFQIVQALPLNFFTWTFSQTAGKQVALNSFKYLIIFSKFPFERSFLC